MEKFGSPGEEDDEIEDDPPLQIWGTLETGESLWWQPVRDDPAKYLVVVIGNGWQQLNISTTEFLRRWTGGLLDLPTMSRGAVKREWTLTPAGQPVTVPDVPDVPRDPLAQLKTITGRVTLSRKHSTGPGSRRTSAPACRRTTCS